MISNVLVLGLFLLKGLLMLIWLILAVIRCDQHFQNLPNIASWVESLQIPRNIRLLRKTKLLNENLNLLKTKFDVLEAHILEVVDAEQEGKETSDINSSMDVSLSEIASNWLQLHPSILQIS